MADIVERLRQDFTTDPIPLHAEAAEEIERLRAFKYLHDRAVEQRTDALAECHKMRDEIARLHERCEAYKGQVEAGANEIARLRANNERLRAALGEIIAADQREKRTCTNFDPAGCDYDVTMIDGPCAAIARRASEQKVRAND